MKFSFLLLALMASALLKAQQGWWLAQIHRPDGENIVFNFEWKKTGTKNTWYIKNATERIKIDDISMEGDSLIVKMPVFESEFHLRTFKDHISGSWVNKAASNTQILPFTATPGNKRFETFSSPATDISGRWSVKYEGDSLPKTVAEFEQSGNIVTGTFLNPTGDYRYLEGVVRNDSLLLSSFDGSHLFLFKAAINKNIFQGVQYSGASGKKKWRAVKDSSAHVSEESVKMHLKPGEDRLHFAFKDMDGKMVSIADKRFINKVVIVQLMGSWCPNCMDETEFLSDYYRKNRQRGIEIVALAYEYTTDWKRSVNSLQKFRKRFDIQYPVLITGVTVLDSLRTEKTLPELTPIKFFPSSVIIDKKGLVRKLDTGFNGPATGEHYILFKKEFEAVIDNLLSEK